MPPPTASRPKLSRTAPAILILSRNMVFSTPSSSVRTAKTSSELHNVVRVSRFLRLDSDFRDDRLVFWCETQFVDDASRAQDPELGCRAIGQRHFYVLGQSERLLGRALFEDQSQRGLLQVEGLDDGDD